MTASSDPARRRVELFAELCELDDDARAQALARVAAEDPALAFEVERMLRFDADPGGPIDQLREEVAAAAGRLLLPDTASPPPERLGAWKLGRRLGAGGMGEVWAAERADGGFTQRAAVKLVRSGMASAAVVSRFEVERQLLALLDHPAIATLFDGGIAPDGRPWFAMELVEGVPITRFADEQDLGIEARIRLLLDVAEAVDAAHRSLIVHRDLKPSNILVTSDGSPKLLDFGLAKLLDADSGADLHATRTELRALTPAYAAPEQIRGEAATTATDVYALGVILYELLTGELPHQRRSTSAAMLAAEVVGEAAERPSSRLRRLESARPDGARRARRLSGDLDTIALKALAGDRNRRYPSVAAFSADLVAHLEGRPIAARPDTAGYRLSKFVGRHRLGVAAAAVVLLSLVGALTVSLRQTARANAAALAARIEATRAERVKGFLVSVFDQANPTKNQGAELSARQILDEGARRLENELRDEPEVRAELHDTVARIQLSLGLFDESLASAQRAASERTRLFGPRSVERAASLGTIGVALLAQGRSDEAEAPIAEAVRIFEETGSQGSIDYARAISAQAHVRMVHGQGAEAIALERRAHGISSAVLGPHDPATLEHASNVAVLESEQANYAEAIRAYREILAILEPREPKDSANVLAVVLNLATALDIAGRSEEALPLFLRVLAGRRAIFDANHPLLAETLVIVSLRLSRAGRGEEALALLGEARAIYQPLDHPELGSVDNFTGIVLSDLGRFAQAEIAGRRAVARFVLDLGEDAVLTATARGNLAYAVAAAGRPAEALPLFESAIVSLRAAGELDNPRLLRLRLNWGATLRRLGRYADARAVLDAGAEVARRKLDAEHVSITEFELELARIDLSENAGSAVDRVAERILRAEAVAAKNPQARGLARLLAAAKSELAALRR